SPAAFCASLGEFQSDVFAAWAMSRHMSKYAVVACERATSARDSEGEEPDADPLAEPADVPPPPCEVEPVDPAAPQPAINSVRTAAPTLPATRPADVPAPKTTTVTSPRERRRSRHPAYERFPRLSLRPVPTARCERRPTRSNFKAG